MRIRFSKLIQQVSFYFIMTVIIFLCIEGLSSIILSISVISNRIPLKETYHTEYDELLGWKNIPNLAIKDFYGPGKDFITNSQSFRNDKDFIVKIPGNKIRIICSGDSFTLGFNVSNENTWCQSLTKFDERIESVNMGQGGYGVDQAYLWYMQDGKKLDHNVHLFAFIEDDFKRAQRRVFVPGYEKPVLTVENNSLVPSNIPVPKHAYANPRLTDFLRNLQVLKSAELINKFRRKTGIKIISGNIHSDEQIRKIALKMFESLHQINKEKGSTFIAVYLPEKADYSRTSEWRAFLNVELTKRGIMFIDITDDFKKKPIELMFDGHYSKEGNEHVASIIYNKLLSSHETSILFKD